jgi:hypothetical protein
MMIRLEPPIEVETPKGRGWAIVLRDYGYDYDDLWTCLISETKEFWTFRNKEIKGVDNLTFGVGVEKSCERCAGQITEVWCNKKNASVDSYCNTCMGMCEVISVAP